MKKYKKFIVVTLIMIAFIGAIYIARQDSARKVPVREVVVENRVLTKTVSASGKITSRNKSDLTFGTAGKIYEMYVKKGDKVNKGDLIGVLENYTLAQTAQAAKDARDIAIRDRDLYVELYSTNKNAVSGEDEYNISLRRLDELVSQAEAGYQAKASLVTDSYLYAPFEGVIVDLHKEKGESVITTTPVVTLADLDNLEFEIELGQEDYGLVQLNQEVSVILDAFEDHEFPAFVSDLPLYADGSSSSNFIVTITLKENGNEKALLGMTGDAKIIVASSENPVKSVFYDDIFYDEEDSPFVWVVEDGKIYKHTIEIGMEGDIYTELLTEIQGQIVAGINDDVEIKDGYKASLVK